MAGALPAAAARFPDAGMRLDGTRLPYPELLDRSLRALTGIRAAGLSRGDRVVLPAGPAREFFPLLWACLLDGIVPVVTARPDGGPLAARLESARSRLGDPVVLLGGSAAPSHWRVVDPAGFEDGERAALPPEPAPAEVALVLLSSGSTGAPKLIPLTHDALVRSAYGVREELPVGPADVLMNWMPLDGSGGLLLFPLSGAWMGAETLTVATESVLGSPERWLGLLEEHAVTHVWAPNFALRRMADAVDGSPDGRWSLGSLRWLGCAGERILPSTVDDALAALARFGSRPAFMPMWGMTETATGISFGRGTRHRLRPSSLDGPLEEAGPGEAAVEFFGVGRPAPGASFRITGPDGVLEEGRIGRLEVSSPRITPGYLGEPAPVAGGWFASGDLGFLRDGELVFTGRAAELLIVNGRNVYAHEIEEAALVPGAVAVAACGIPSEATGTEEAAVFAEPEPGADVPDLLRRIRAAVADRLRLTLAHVVAVSALPRTTTGKPRRAELRDRLLAGDLKAPAPPLAPATPEMSHPPRNGSGWSPDDGVFAGLDPSRPFFEQGLGSVDLARLREEITARLGREVPLTDLYAHPSLDALAAHLDAPAGTFPPPAREPAGDRRVAVIGMAARFPGAPDVAAFWANLLAGTESVTAFPHLDAPGKVAAAGILSDVDAFDHVFFATSPREAALTDPQHRLFAEVAHHALEQAGYAATTARVGIYAGGGMNLHPHHTYLRGNLGEVVDGGDPLDAIATAIGNQPDFLATRVAHRLGLTGPAIGVQTACSTSLVAVHLAARALLAGDAELAIAGAAAVHLPQETAYPYAEGLINSASGHCRPFDAGADGTVGGSGVAAVVLKPYAKAVADGDTIHAVILGSAVNNDGAAKVGYTAPGEAGQAEVLRLALADAGVPPESVGYIEAHGTGTPVGDPIEAAALAKVYPPGTILSSVKANIGHLDSCAGMAGLIKALLVLRHGVIPPQINYTRPNPALTGDFTILPEGGDWTAGGPRRAGVTALGVGGTNAHVILEEPPSMPEGDPSGPVVLPLSAADPQALAELAAAFSDIEAAPADLITGLASRRRFRHRIAVAAADTAGLAAALASAVPGEPVPGSLAFLYTGQGARFGPVLELERYPAFADALAEAAEAHPGDLRALLAAPDPGWDTDVAQPVLTALQCALTALWESLGLRPSLVAGHSAGEIAALAAAGALSIGDAVRLAAARGRLMRQTREGGMLAVLGPEAEARALLAAVPELELSVENGDGHRVLGGSAAAVDTAEREADARGLAVRRLPVRRAFHTALLDPVLPELSRIDAGFRPLRVPFASGVDGVVRPVGWTPDGEYLRRQAREPVRFPAVLDALAGAGCGTFLELGPEGVLSAIGRRHDPAKAWVPSLRPGKGAVLGVAKAVAALFTAGTEVDWAAYAPGGRRVPLPGYPYRRHRHWIEPSAPAAPAPAGDVLERVREITAELIGVPSVPADTPFAELGADSLSLVNLTRRLGTEYGVRVAMRELFADLDTPRAVAAAVAERGGAVPVPVQPEPEPVPETAAVEPVGLEAVVHRQLAIMEEQLRLLREAGAPPAPAPAPEPVDVRAIVHDVRPEPVGASTLDFGLYFFGDYPEGRAHGYRHLLDAATFADEHGFSSVWLPERHFHSFGGVFPNPSVLAAAVAARTSRVRINAGSVVLPLHHPVRVAEEWSIVDNLSGGRAGIGIASGWHADDFVFAPENFGRHKEVMYEHLDVIRRLWAGESVPARSGSGADIEVSLFPRPVQEAPPIFAAVVGNPESYRQAAAHGLGVVTNLMAQDVATLARNIALYREERARHGLDAGRVVVLVHTHLGGDDAAAKAAAFEPFCAYLRSSLSLLGQVANSLGMNIDLENTPEEDVRFLLGRAYERYCAERALIGSPDAVAGVAEAIRAAGADEIAAFVDFGLSPDELAAGLPWLDVLRRRFVSGEETAPLSPGQRRLWTVDRLRPGGTGLNEAVALRLSGDLDVARLHTALQGLVDRHAPLRTAYREHDGEPCQVVRPSVRVDLPVSEHDDEDTAVAGAMEEEGRRVFDLAEGPVFAFRLLRVPGAHVLVLCFHHIAADGGSYAVLGPELSALYRGEALPPLPVTYPRVARERATAPGTEYWERVLAALPEPLALPSDRERPPAVTGAGRTIFHGVPDGLHERVTAFARAHRVTPFAVLLAGVAGAVSLLTGRDDFVLGTGMSGRDERTAGVFGFFVETVPLRIGVAGDEGLAALATRLRDLVAEAVDHAATPFDAIVRAVNPPRRPGHDPLIDIAVEFSDGELFALDLPGVTATRLPVGPAKAAADIVLFLSRSDWQVEFRTDVYGEEVVRSWLALAVEVLERGMSGPGTALTGLIPAAPAVSLGGPPSDVDDRDLYALFAASAAASPGATAIVCGDEEWSYAELAARAGDFAAALAAEGVRPGEVVAVHLPRRPDLVAAQLGALRLGAAFMPIDPATPAARAALLARDARALVTDGGGPPHPSTVDVGAIKPAEAPPVVARAPGDLAYVVHTSGSTGRPKAVAVPHRAVTSAVRWRAKSTGLAPGDRAAHQLGLGFDANLAEIHSALAAGAALHLMPSTAQGDPAALAAWWREAGITVACLPTALTEQLFAVPVPPSVRLLITGGSRLHRRPPAGFPPLVNEYGPTENGIVTTAGRVEPGDGLPHIGAPLPGHELSIVDRLGRAVPPGVAGELWVRGPGLALGYLGDPEAAAFRDGWYRTGDLVRARPDGNLDFLGRVDEQVKIRGNRAEPGEAAAVLAGLPGVRDAAVLAIEDGGETVLAAYVVGAAPVTELAARMAELLPGYLVPARWSVLDALPLTPSGKLDRARLPEPSRPESGTRAEPATELERELHEAWCAELGLSTAGVEDDFFALGGDSLGVVRLANRLREHGVSVADIFARPTIRSLAAGLEVVEDSGPLSIQQETMLPRTTPGPHLAMQIATRLDFTGDLDVPAARAAVDALVARHPVLRTRLADGRQEVLRHRPMEIPLDVLDGESAADWSLRHAVAHIDPAAPPVLRARLARGGPGEWSLLMFAPHIALDGWSVLRLLEEFAVLYRDPRAELPPPAATYVDYASAQRATGDDPRLRDYWARALRGAPRTLVLPTDRPREGAAPGGAEHAFALPPETVARLEALAAGMRAPVSPVLLTGYALLLSALTGETDVVIAYPFASRMKRELEGVVGKFAETMPVRVDVGGGGSFADLAAGFHRSAIEALAHQPYLAQQISRAVDPSWAPGSPRPFASAVVAVNPPVPELDLPGLRTTVVDLALGEARNDFTLMLIPSPGRIIGAVEYATGLFDAATVAGWMDAYAGLLDRVSREPGTPVDALLDRLRLR